MQNIMLAFAAAFAMTAVIGPYTIRTLQKMKFGQKILEIGPKWHMSKQYTPTMGGIMFIIPITIATALLGIGAMKEGNYSHIAVLCLALAFGFIGFIDDYTKIAKKQNQGLTALQKLLLQIIIAVVFIIVLRQMGYVNPHLYIPFFNVYISTSWTFFIPFSAFIIVGGVNAVNLTDGIDGLASGVTLPVAVFFAVSAVLMKIPEVSVFAAALAGGICAFLIYNFNPAKVFMGDTGSLFLGGAVCGLAFATDMPVILVIVGAVYVIETLSDIIQVLYFKLSGGKRIFKMAPIHHHFEMCGWSEKKIVFIFAGITIVLCVIGYIGILGRVL